MSGWSPAVDADEIACGGDVAKDGDRRVIRAVSYFECPEVAPVATFSEQTKDITIGPRHSAAGWNYDFVCAGAQFATGQRESAVNRQIGEAESRAIGVRQLEILERAAP